MLKRKIALTFIFALLLSVGFPCGIVMIVMFARQPWLLTLGIVLAVLGFYCMPILWLHYAKLKSDKKLCEKIQLDNLQEINYLAQLNNVDEDAMINRLCELINKRYLLGYEIVDNKFIVKQSEKRISKSEALRQARDTETIVCKGCGAPVEIVAGEKIFCPYCGRPLNK